MAPRLTTNDYIWMYHRIMSENLKIVRPTPSGRTVRLILNRPMSERERADFEEFQSSVSTDAPLRFSDVKLGRVVAMEELGSSHDCTPFGVLEFSLPDREGVAFHERRMSDAKILLRRINEARRHREAEERLGEAARIQDAEEREREMLREVDARIASWAPDDE